VAKFSDELLAITKAKKNNRQSARKFIMINDNDWMVPILSYEAKSLPSI
jgi:hypothetical protein